MNKIEMCKELAKRYPKIVTNRYYCRVEGRWDERAVYESAQNGYKRATGRVPCPEVVELLALFDRPISLSVDDYGSFKADEWKFLANKLLEVV